MQCDMCGKDIEIAYKTEVEGVILNLCKQCSKYGKVLGKTQMGISYQDIKKPKEIEKFEENIKIEEEIEKIVDNYAEIIKTAREKKGLKQEELAKIIAEKESILHKIEANKHPPDIQLARKLEKVLGVKLIEKVKNTQNIQKNKTKQEHITIGDVVEIRRRA